MITATMVKDGQQRDKLWLNIIKKRRCEKWITKFIGLGIKNLTKGN